MSTTTTNTLGSSKEFEQRATQLGVDIAATLEALLEDVPGAPHTPQNLARTLNLDKVFTSRLLKALRNRDPLAVIHRLPGPDPLRRLSRGARRRGGKASLIKAAESAIDRFELMIRQEAGDRSSFGALLSAWLPTAREELELRHRQAAYKAMSLLKGSSVDMNYSAVLLSPSSDAGRLDIVWLFGIYGLRRLRPDVLSKFTTHRIVNGEEPRQPLSLEGMRITSLANARLDQFCFAPPAPLELVRVGDTVHYVLGDSGFGPSSAVDLVFAELNRSEIQSVLPAGSNRKGWVFSNIGLPSKQTQLDVFVHKDVYPGQEPELLLYDTCSDGVADVNDPVRDIDRCDTTESVESLGSGTKKLRSKEIPDYSNLLEHVFERLDWDPNLFRGFQVRMDYPIYGSQISLAFSAPESSTR